MFVVGPIVRAPKQSEMALSAQVKEATEQAANSIREALAFAARGEHPTTISMLTDVLCRLESLDCVDQLMERFSAKQNPPDQNWHRGA